jgi:hypothetical protein
MSNSQKNSVLMVYKNFIDNEYLLNNGWSDMDESMWQLEFLSDEETITEAEVLINKHSQYVVKCSDYCEYRSDMVPQLLEAVGAIIEVWVYSGGILHPKNRYIIHNYLAMSFLKMIYVE